MRTQRSEHFNYPRGFQTFTTASIPELNLKLVGQNIAKFRLQRGWTEDELVVKLQLPGCNITRQILVNIETGRCAATDAQIVFFSEVFRVPVEDLFPPRPQCGNGIADKEISGSGTE